MKSLSWFRGLPLDSKQLNDELIHVAEQLGLKLPLSPLPPKEPFFRQILQKITCKISLKIFHVIRIITLVYILIAGVQTYSPRENEWFSSSTKTSIKHLLKLLCK